MENKVKFLIIRLSSIGDIVLTTPVLRCLKSQIQEAEIHYLVKEKFFDVIKNNPHIDKIHIFSNNLNSIIEQLKYENFDFVIDLHHNIRSYKVKTALKRVSFSFNKLNYYKWLMVNFKINKLPPIHIVDRYFDTLKLFDVENDYKGLDYFIDQKDTDEASIETGVSPGEYIAFSIGGAHNTKKMPENLIAEIINAVDYPFILLGGNDDAIAATEIQKMVNRPLLQFCGKLSLNQSAAIIKNAKLIITHDTGLMHIAAAFKKTILSVWGNTIPEFGMYPYLPDEKSRIFEVKNLRCRPCSKIGFKHCPKGHFKCMTNQNINEIIDYIRYLIANN